MLQQWAKPKGTKKMENNNLRAEMLDNDQLMKYVDDLDRLVGTYIFRLKDIDIPIRIYIFEYIIGVPADYRYRFVTSHFIKAPHLMSSYHPGIASSSANTINETVMKAINCIFEHYNSAIDKGHQPNNKWLEYNEYLNPLN